MDSVEILMTFIGIPFVWYLMWKKCRPNDPKSRRRNIQIGHLDVWVSRRGLYYFYVVIFVFVIIVTLLHMLGIK